VSGDEQWNSMVARIEKANPSYRVHLFFREDLWCAVLRERRGKDWQDDPFGFATGTTPYQAMMSLYDVLRSYGLHEPPKTDKTADRKKFFL